MSTPHRGLPPPAAMALPPQQASTSGMPSTSHHGHHQQQQPQQPQQQPPHHPPPLSLQHSHSLEPSVVHGQSWTALPPPPQQWHGAEEAMKSWLQARAEEEKTKQEEEKTRQEGLRLEQRRVEMDMLRDSIRGGIPPPMIPLVFAGMSSGGALPQVALDWAQQFFPSSQVQQHLQLLPAQRQQSPDVQQQREGHAASQGTYPPGSGHQPPPPPPPPPPGTGTYGSYPASPSRPRGQTVSGIVGRTAGGGGNVPPHVGHGQPGGSITVSPYSGGSHSSHMQTPSGPPQESSPSLYFHHWQPPAPQAGSGSSVRPGSPSGDLSRKRKVTGPQATEAHGEQRPRSPPSFIQSTLSNPPPSRRGGHKRQKSDVSWYRPTGYSSIEESERGAPPPPPPPQQQQQQQQTAPPVSQPQPPPPLPPPPGITSARDVKGEFPRQERYVGESSRHSVSTLLSHDTPGQSSREAPPRSHFPPAHEDDRQVSRHREEISLRRDRGSPRRESD
ncbi:hypothetical protein E4U54_008725 [Claviceps lovelessii]|nr:hypothetical protein E4U54_008725 [Claviceps lovelessii]